jgi:hypothetical protein
VSNGALTMRLDHCPNVLGDAFQKLIVTLSNATSSAKDSPYTPIGPLQIDSITADTVAFSNGRTMHR